MADLIDQWSQEAPAQPQQAAPVVAAQPNGAADLIDAWGGAPSPLSQRTVLQNTPHGVQLRYMTQDEAAAADNQKPLPVAHPESLDDWLEVGERVLTAPMRAAAGVPGAIAKDFGAAKNLVGQGVADIRNGDYLPSFPSVDPRTWSAGGAGKVAAGIAGMAGSPFSGVAEKFVGEPVTEATGNPQAGEIASMAAAGLMPGALASKIAGAPASAETLRLANVAQDAGIPIRASQISTNPVVNKIDQVVGWIPGSGRAGENAAQQSAFTRAVSHSFGEDTDQITRQTINNATRRIGGVMNDVEARTPVTLDPQAISSIAQVETNAARAFTRDSPQYRQISNQIDQILNVAVQHHGTVPGDVWANFLHQGSPLSRLEGGADTDVGQLAGSLKDAMRDALQRQATPEDAQAYANARFQYKNMKTVEPLVTTGAPGEISPVGLNQKVRTNFDTRNAGPLGELADVGQRFLRQPKDSGTPIGEAVLRAVTAPGSVLGGALAGHSLGLSLPEIAGMSVAAPAINATTARIASALLNNPLYRNSLLRGPSDLRSLADELIYGGVPAATVAGNASPPQIGR
jgi:hypothetical protein